MLDGHGQLGASANTCKQNEYQGQIGLCYWAQWERGSETLQGASCTEGIFLGTWDRFWRRFLPSPCKWQCVWWFHWIPLWTGAHFNWCYKRLHEFLAKRRDLRGAARGVCPEGGFCVSSEENSVLATPGATRVRCSFAQFLLAVNCKQSAAYPKLYIWESDGDFVLFLVQVDDILLILKTDEVLQRVMDHFKKSFYIRICRKIEKFLVFSMVDRADCIQLHNTPMVERTLAYFRMWDCKALSIPT